MTDYSAYHWAKKAEEWAQQAAGVTSVNGKTGTVTLDASDVGAQETLVSGTNIKTINNSTILGSGNLDIDALPSQSGQSGKYLTTNGTSANWAVPKTHNLFDFIWRDAELNDQSWLRADTFSWQDGTVYTNAYNHLVDEFLSGQRGQSETIAGITIYYNLAPDGHKIVDASYSAEVQHVEDIYNATGVAWYYILDTTNQRFKLPRTKYGFVGLRDTVGKYVPETLPNIKGHPCAKQNDNDGTPTGAFKRGTSNAYVGFSSDSGHFVDLDASLASSTYQDDAPVQQRATQMYLYFYIGQFSQSATEQTAGLNAELFNGKMDLDAGNTTSATVNTIISKADSTAKQTVNGWGKPDYSAGISISFPYTCPKNGFYIGTTTNDNAGTLYINSIQLVFPGNYMDASPCFFPVSAGDVITGKQSHRTFYPCKGA